MADRRSIEMVAFNFSTFAYTRVARDLCRAMSVFFKSMGEFFDSIKNSHHCDQYVDDNGFAANDAHHLIMNLRLLNWPNMLMKLTETSTNEVNWP